MGQEQLRAELSTPVLANPRRASDRSMVALEYATAVIAMIAAILLAVTH
jgi:hypothetical protein